MGISDNSGCTWFVVAKKLYNNKSLSRLTIFAYNKNTSHSKSQAKAGTVYFRSKNFLRLMDNAPYVHRRTLYPQKGTIPLVTLSWRSTYFITMIAASQEKRTFVYIVFLFYIVCFIIKMSNYTLSKLTLISGVCKLQSTGELFISRRDLLLPARHS